MKKEIKRPSHDEYAKFVESEFSFLETDYGFNKIWDQQDRFRVVYTGGQISVHVWGWDYGESGHVSLNLGNEELPYAKYVTSFERKLTESTGKRQLDDLKEHAHRLRFECKEILRGDLSSMLPLRPFPNAEELWFKRDFVKIIKNLKDSEKTLSPLWQSRYEYALKNS